MFLRDRNIPELRSLTVRIEKKNFMKNLIVNLKKIGYFCKMKTITPYVILRFEKEDLSWQL